MNKQKIAWVSGMAGAYTLNVSASRAPDFAHLDYIQFTNFRAAQDIANAIKAHVAKNAKGAKA